MLLYNLIFLKKNNVPCEEVLGHLYRASKNGLEELVATVPAATRAMLALYCYRRAHLQSIGLAVASSCTVDDLETFGGNAGKALFEKARNVHDRPHALNILHGERFRDLPGCHDGSSKTKTVVATKGAP